MASLLFFKNLYLKSLTPFELLKISKKYKCSFEKKVDSSYLASWKSCLSNNESQELFREYLSFNGLVASDVTLMTSIIDIEGNIDFPIWIKILEEIFCNINFKFEENTKIRKKPFYPLLSPFIDFFSSRFKQNLKTLNIAVRNNLVDQLKSSLYKDLLNLSHEVLFNEFNEFKKGKEGYLKGVEENYLFKKFVLKIFSNKYQDLFLCYPMLARKLATKTHAYLEFITSIFKKFEKDRFEIQYFFDTKIKEIKKLHINSGDIHNGESTIILEFKNSYKLVYKPTNTSITHAYNKFLDWVNIHLGCELRSFNVIDKENYSWLEYIENKECNNLEDVKIYYERAGILSGIAYFLNARDYHYENLIANGNSPILIDHETIVNPIVKNKTKKVKVGNVLDTLLLPNKDKNEPPYIFGFGSSKQIKKNEFIPKIINTNKDNMKKILEIESFKLYKLNKPKFNKKIENLINYEIEFIKGFKQLYDLILEKKSFLLSDNSPLKNFENLKIRFINRPTGVYFKLLTLLNKPEYLKDAIKFGIKIELLARAYAIRRDWSPVLNSEREQILSGNIPVFYSNTLSKNLIVPIGHIADEFEFNAMEAVYHKIKKADYGDYQNQLHLIKEAVVL